MKVPSRSSLAHTAKGGLFLVAGSCQEGRLVYPAIAVTASPLQSSSSVRYVGTCSATMQAAG